MFPKISRNPIKKTQKEESMGIFDQRKVKLCVWGKEQGLCHIAWQCSDFLQDH